MTADVSAVSVLVVDDNSAKRFALSAVLSPLGFNVVEAESGMEALRCLMAADFAVILLDVLMPVMDGFETASRIRARPRSEMTPIIFITAHGPDEVSHADHYAQGAVDFIFAPIPPEELRAKVSVFANLFAKAEELAVHARAVQSTADQLSDRNVELAAIARHDPLTGLRNRRALTEDLEMHEAKVIRYGHSYCMGLLDIDHFKAYNDSYGHQAGDVILQTIATALTSLLRRGDALYRYGGEELLCIFPEQTIESGGLAVERMRAGVEDLGLTHAGSPSGVVTISAGLAVLDMDLQRSAHEVLTEADGALYRAKSLGRNRVERAGPEPVWPAPATATLTPTV
jgi:two-component system cell cycle response regulator